MVCHRQLFYDLSDKVDALLRGFSVNPEIRTMTEGEFVTSKGESVSLNPTINDELCGLIFVL